MMHFHSYHLPQPRCRETLNTLLSNLKPPQFSTDELDFVGIDLDVGVSHVGHWLFEAFRGCGGETQLPITLTMSDAVPDGVEGREKTIVR